MKYGVKSKTYSRYLEEFGSYGEARVFTLKLREIWNNATMQIYEIDGLQEDRLVEQFSPTKGVNYNKITTIPNITDKNNNEVNFGDKYLATMITPSTEKGTVVTVVIDLSKENIDCDRNFNVEDDEGNRIWNAYMVIRTSEPLTNQSEEEKNKYDKNKI